MIANRNPGKTRRRLALPLCLFALCGCSSGGGAAGGDDPIPTCTPTVAPAPTPPPDDKISATRLLRRISLVLSGRVPTIDAYEAMQKAPDPEAVIQKAIDDGLASTEFYEQMVDFGHTWITSGAFSTGAIGDGYSGNMSGHMGQCGGMTAHPGAWYVYQESPVAGNFCDDKDEMGNPAPAPLEVVEPWWAPGTQVTVVGWATKKDLELDLGGGKKASCASASTLYFNAGSAPGCGCGPNLVWCYPGSGLGSGSNLDDKQQRRHVWDEPARLVAHLAWYDRPLSDLVTGNYTVANNMVRAEYLRLARRTGAYPELDGNTTWWKPSLDKGPRDPLHTDPDDPWAWRELVVEELAPFLMAANADKSKTPNGDLSRTFSWDPRTETTASPGIAAAGVLTMPGVNSSFTRERPRAARFLETFACQKFTPPPPALNLGPPGVDIAKTGTCQHCHKLMDPVAVAFKRWDYDNSGYIPFAMLVDVGPWKVTPEQLDGMYPHNGNPFSRWRGSWIPGTVLTPVTDADVTKNPGALALDTIPKEYEILGVHPDGTSGPLGFGKVLVTSGAFDRCAAQKLYERFVGRPLDPELESLYISALGDEFAKGGRKVKPFIRSLLAKPELRRGL
jgi:hypothetical protein